LQVYRVRFGSSAATLEPNLHRGPAAESSAAPFSFERFFPH
jgi:hypothetical protein